MSIVPTIGRVVLYFPAPTDKEVRRYDDKPCAAHVCYVWSDNIINLLVIDHAGRTWPRTSVPINETQGASAWAEWMPYQIGQAKKHEADAK